MRERGKDAWKFEPWDKCVQLSPAESQFKERSRIQRDQDYTECVDQRCMRDIQVKVVIGVCNVTERSGHLKRQILKGQHIKPMRINECIFISDSISIRIQCEFTVKPQETYLRGKQKRCEKNGSQMNEVNQNSLNVMEAKEIESFPN